MTDSKTAVTPAKSDDEMMHDVERVIIGGDLRGLQPGQRLWYYGYRARQAGLDPLTQPFNWLSNRKTGSQSLYLNKEGAAQLRKKHGISIEIVSAAEAGDYFEVRAKASTTDGRHDEDFGGAYLKGLVGDDRMNAKALAFTRAKRRVSISIVGLGMLDESEVAGVREMSTLRVDPGTGEVLEPAGNGQQARPKPAATPAALADQPAKTEAPETETEEDMTGEWPAQVDGQPASEAQLKVLWGLWRGHGQTKEALEEFCRLCYDVQSPRVLSAGTVQGIILHLRRTSTAKMIASLARLFADDTVSL